MRQKMQQPLQLKVQASGLRTPNDQYVDLLEVTGFNSLKVRRRGDHTVLTISPADVIGITLNPGQDPELELVVRVTGKRGSGTKSFPRRGSLPADGSIPQLEHYEDMNGDVLATGDAVVAVNGDGPVTEGNVRMLLPWGCEWLDKTWTECTVVIEDHNSHQLSNWNPKNVERTGP